VHMIAHAFSLVFSTYVIYTSFPHSLPPSLPPSFPQGAQGLAHCPLFRRALEFLAHHERMVRTAARTVVLSLYQGDENEKHSPSSLPPSLLPSPFFQFSFNPPSLFLVKETDMRQFLTSGASKKALFSIT